jgi:predicted DNA-binding transcriptional regulator YafY
MNKFGEHSPKVRLLLVVRAILDRPFAHTRQSLADEFGVHKDTIKRDLEGIVNAGFVLDLDDRYRYAFAADQPLKQLKDLLHFSAEDQALLDQAIDQVAPTTQQAKRLRAKLASLYDFRKLGHSYLRNPYLNKVDALLMAKEEKRQVVLENYRSSNSNEVSHRRVEPFHPSPSDDTVHTFDVEKQALRHFRISRFTRVQLLDAPWQYENHHVIRATDPFRIVDEEQVMVHLRFGVGAYNELIERYPLTKGCIEPSEVPDYYDFQGEVNHRFIGLTNFILGNYHQEVEVLAPDELLEHLRKMVQSMVF